MRACVTQRARSHRTVCAVSDASLTLQEAAEVLGVHYMTAYRYVRLGLLHATKVGGTWHVAASDLEAFRSGSATPVSDPTNAKRRAPWASRLEARLVAGDSAGAWGVVEAAMTAGSELDEIYLDVVAPAMRNIGARWERGELDISVEHRATGIAQRIIGRLGPRFGRRGRSRGTILLGTPEGERHSLPVAMISDLLRGVGWEVSDLGSDLPVGSFLAAVRDTPDLVAVGVSISSHEGLAAAPALLSAVRAARPDVPVVAGGHAVHGVDHALELGATAYADTVDHFVELLDGRGMGASAGA